MELGAWNLVYLIAELMVDTLKPVWNDPSGKTTLFGKNNFPFSAHFYLQLDSMQTEPFQYNHLSGKTTFS